MSAKTALTMACAGHAHLRQCCSYFYFHDRMGPRGFVNVPLPHALLVGGMALVNLLAEQTTE